MQPPETHTSREIAQAMADRAFARVFPQSVKLPRETCPRCDGTGDRDDRELHIPQEDRTPCRLCKGAGTVKQWCSWCKRAATVVTFDEDGYRWEVCEVCATDTRDGDVVAFALRTLP